MKRTEVYENTQLAFQKGEVTELLSGQNGYCLRVAGYGIKLPTCSEMLFQEGIFPLYQKSSIEEQAEIEQQIDRSIRILVHSDDPIMVWWALSLLCDLQLYQKLFSSPIRVHSDEILSELKPCLYDRKNDLTGCFRYAGELYQNGLWGDVLQCLKILTKKE